MWVRGVFEPGVGALAGVVVGGAAFGDQSFRAVGDGAVEQLVGGQPVGGQILVVVDGYDRNAVGVGHRQSCEGGAAGVVGLVEQAGLAQ